MSYEALLRLSAQAANLTAEACASCAKHDPLHNCCGGCAPNVGYLYGLSKQAVVKIKETFGWTKDRGFLTSKGCRLPREVRSPVCLQFYCNPIIQDRQWLKWFPNSTALKEKKIDKPVLPNEVARALRRHFDIGEQEWRVAMEDKFNV